MRKLFLILAVLLLASAVYAADVTISCAQVGETNEVIISYLASAEANIPRAFALDIQLDNAETIYAVTPSDPCYWVYPGTYGDTNTPVGEVADSPSDTLPGIDSNGVTIEMGSLHSPPEVTSDSAPGTNGDLLSIMVTGTCNMSIKGNAARGKVVFYDATNEDDGRDVSYGTGCAINIPTICYTGPDVSEFMAVGEPDSWCYVRQCHGDADNAEEYWGGRNNTDFHAWVGYNDTAVLVSGFRDTVYVDEATDPWIAADFDHAAEYWGGRNNTDFNARVGYNDVAVLVYHFRDSHGIPPADCLDASPTSP